MIVQGVDWKITLSAYEKVIIGDYRYFRNFSFILLQLRMHLIQSLPNRKWFSSIRVSFDDHQLIWEIHPITKG
jgi:hypothetical protein